VQFRIGPHSRSGAPADAIEQLWQRLSALRSEASFARAGTEITASWDAHAGDSATRELRVEVGRQEILEIIRGACASEPALDLDWFAVSYFE
jgi:hypothetical protein